MAGGGETCGRERLRLASPGEWKGGGWGWAEGGLGVRAIGRGRAGAALLTRQKGTPEVGARPLPPPGERRESGPSPAGLPRDSQPPGGHQAAAEAPARDLACVFGGYFCTGRLSSPEPFPPECRLHGRPGNRGEVI